jgi:tungstate transport system ATP-binding protein
MKEILRYNSLRKSVHGRVLLDIDSLPIYECSCVALSGRNGAGKSTLMRIIAGLEMPDSAAVSYAGRVLSWRHVCRKMHAQVIYLHQNPYLFDASVADNVAYGLRCRGLPLREISSQVSEGLEWAGIGHLHMRNAHDLSGGERQRVAFARARILRPRILLLDEPTANMDIESRSQTYRMIKRLKEDGVSVIVATHEFQTIAHLCDEHMALESGVLRPQPVDPETGERKVIPYG